MTRVAPAVVLMGISIGLLLGCGGGGGGGGSAAAPPPPPTVALSAFVTGVNLPVGLETPDDATGRLFVIEQGGTIRIIRNGALVSTPFLDITANLESGGEKGLLGLAFHPGFAADRRFFVNYTQRVGLQLQTVISEFSVSPANPDQADPLTERVLLVVNQPFDNHNGGQLAFGPDGFLYIGLGDGGSGGDPLGNGQNLQTFLGKILRIDIDGPHALGKQYAIPTGNPFINNASAFPEIWAYGLRNPWRFSFDLPTGRLFGADVGQERFEEVDLIVGGGDFGWNIMEGDSCYPAGTASCNTVGLILPINEYGHDAAGGTAIIGGFVYHGASMPRLLGSYIFGDLSSGHIWGLAQDAQGNWQRTLLLTHTLTVTTFGRDSAGELYLADYGNGAILRVQAGP